MTRLTKTHEKKKTQRWWWR